MFLVEKVFIALFGGGGGATWERGWWRDYPGFNASYIMPSDFPPKPVHVRAELTFSEVARGTEKKYREWKKPERRRKPRRRRQRRKREELRRMKTWRRRQRRRRQRQRQQWPFTFFYLKIIFIPLLNFFNFVTCDFRFVTRCGSWLSRIEF